MNYFLIALVAYLITGFFYCRFHRNQLLKSGVDTNLGFIHIFTWPFPIYLRLRWLRQERASKRYVFTILEPDGKPGWLSTFCFNHENKKYGTVTLGPNNVAGFSFGKNASMDKITAYSYGSDDELKTTVYYINGVTTPKNVWVNQVSATGEFGKYAVFLATSYYGVVTVDKPFIA